MARTDSSASAAAKQTRPPEADQPTEPDERDGYHIHWLVTGGLLGAASWALIGALASVLLGARTLAAGLAGAAVVILLILTGLAVTARRRALRAGLPRPRAGEEGPAQTDHAA